MSTERHGPYSYRATPKPTSEPSDAPGVTSTTGEASNAPESSSSGRPAVTERQKRELRNVDIRFADVDALDGTSVTVLEDDSPYDFQWE